MKIIVRGANWIGDAVMTIPALRSLRALYPDANITLYTKPWAAGVFQDADFIDRVLTVESERSGLGAVFRESRRVAKGSYDLAVLFTNSFQTAAVVRFGNVKRRIGYSREGRAVLLTDPIRPPSWQDERHQSVYYSNIVQELARRSRDTEAAELFRFDCSLPVSEDRRIKARNELAYAGADLSKPTIGLGVGSTNSTAKRWGEQRYAKLADRLSRELGADIVLLGSQAESSAASQVAALSNVDLIDLTGKTDLGLATAILSELDLFVSNDMGLAHLAAATGTRTLVIFGPTNDLTTRPLGEHVEIMRVPVECSPCMLRECPIDHRCMARIAPDVVFQRAAGMIDG